MRGSFEHAYLLLINNFAEVRLVDPDLVFDIQTISLTDSETIKSWTYFLKIFGYDFYGYDTRFIVISDRNHEIINVVPKVISFAIHTFCTFHIFNNIKTTLESTRIAFRMAAEALTKIDFGKHMTDIQNTYPVGLQYILGIPKETWSNLYIPMSSCYVYICHPVILIWHLISIICHLFRYGVACTNHVESWNNVIVKVRDILIHVFIEELRRICSKISYTYREEAKISQACLTPWATVRVESLWWIH
ncbi:hypothetical protein GIB67_005861 [Kingdonia uniflora]|uniref:MULE transposase domain-containing protein n=1 Tax=Kingdonia uniflora TaxID=39325 RepID=A0A7J7NRH0_9MAGN|nr:hypothetical protein GIB67_005861 [Kingdonia uniflora]